MRKCLTQLSPFTGKSSTSSITMRKSVDEAAQIIGVPRSTVKTRMFYGAATWRSCSGCRPAGIRAGRERICRIVTRHAGAGAAPAPPDLSVPPRLHRPGSGALPPPRPNPLRLCRLACARLAYARLAYARLADSEPDQ